MSATPVKSCTPSASSLPRFRQRLWIAGLMLCATGTMLGAAVIGQVVVAAHQRRDFAPWQALAVETVGGGVLMAAGFFTMVSSTSDEAGERSASDNAQTWPADECLLDRAGNEPAFEIGHRRGTEFPG